jgi:hypothetical protein
MLLIKALHVVDIHDIQVKKNTGRFGGDRGEGERQTTGDSALQSTRLVYQRACDLLVYKRYNPNRFISQYERRLFQLTFPPTYTL